LAREHGIHLPVRVEPIKPESKQEPAHA
jgi:hypothetical protein